MWSKSMQCPRSEVIEQNQLSRQFFTFPRAQHLRKIGELSEDKAPVKRLEKIVLMAGQRKARMQSLHGGAEMAAGVRQRYAEDGQVYVHFRRQRVRHPAGFDVDALAARFDEEAQRFA